MKERCTENLDISWPKHPVKDQPEQLPGRAKLTGVGTAGVAPRHRFPDPGLSVTGMLVLMQILGSIQTNGSRIPGLGACGFAFYSVTQVILRYVGL